MDKHWWAPLTGVLFIVLVIVGGLIAGEPPDVDKDVQAIIDHYRDDDDAIMIGTLVQGIAAVALLFFAGIVRRVLRAAEGEGHTLSLVAFGGAVVLATGAAVDGTIAFALAENGEDIEPAAVQALSALWENDFLPFLVGAGTFMLATGLSIVRHGALPKWLGWLAIVIGVVTMTPVGFFGIIAAALWILITSVILTLRARADGSPPAPIAPASAA